jgi:signal peptidase I
MVHDTIPFINKRSYAKWPQLPYFRFPGFEKVKKNDIVVFNWPTDTVTHFKDHTTVGLRKPVDKKTNYVKRCVGAPGDIFSLKDGIVFINDKELILSDRAKPQYSYTITTDGTLLNYTVIKEQMHVTDEFGQINSKTYSFRSLTDENATILRNTPGVLSVVRNITKDSDSSSEIFPHTKDWNLDNMGPIYIPEEGKTVKLDTETLPFYKMIIKEYEHNDLQVDGGQIKINGKVTTEYTFKQNYYWMMGDNRHNSLDSRYWGFVPADHIVGKPVFIWMSLDANKPWGFKKVRWERLFTTVGGNDEPVSYFKYFIILLAGWFVFSHFRKKKQGAKTDI